MASTLSLNFDGVNEFVTMGDVLDFEFNQAHSISCWFKTTDTNGYLVSKVEGIIRGYGLIVNLSPAGSLRYVLLNTSTVGVEVNTEFAGFNDGRWHHVVATYTGNGLASGVAFYTDGRLRTATVIRDNLAGNTTVNAGSFNINGRTNGSATLTTFIDEVAIYDKALSLAEVQAIYGNPQTREPADLTVTGPTGNLVGYWRCGEGATFPTIPDDSPGGNNGTMTNMEVGDISSSVPSETVFGMVFEDFDEITEFVYDKSPSAGPVVFKMRALADPGPGYVTWTVTATPDFAGTFAPAAIQAGTAVVSDSW